MELSKAYVIVKEWGGQYDFIQNFISLDKEEIDKKCKEFNDEANAMWKKNYEKSKRNLKRGPYTETIIFVVMDLAKAIESFGDSVADAHTEHDESY